MASHIFVVITLQKQSVFICDMLTGVVKGTKHAFIEHNTRTNLATVDNNRSVNIPEPQLHGVAFGPMYGLSLRLCDLDANNSPT